MVAITTSILGSFFFASIVTTSLGISSLVTAK